MREAFESILKIGRYWAGAGVIEIMDLDPASPTYRKFWASRSSDRMWARIILRSAMSRGGLESTTAAAAWLDEAGQDAFTLQTWEAVQRRLSLFQGRVLITTTLYQNHGWLKTLHDKWLKGDRTIDVIQFDSTLNPAFSDEEFERARANMQDWRFDLFYRGKFATPPGQIYHLADDQVVSYFVIPSAWPRYVGVDFGAVNTALVWLAHDQYGRGPGKIPDSYYLYRSSLSGNKTTEQHCNEALAHTRDVYPDGRIVTKENVAGWWGGSPSEVQQRLDWMNAGVPVIQPPVSDVEAGIDRVTSLINHKRLFIFNTETDVINDFQNYSREMDDEGRVFETIRDKENYHKLDSVRYLACGLVGHELQEAPGIW